jgi:DNA primase
MKTQYDLESVSELMIESITELLDYFDIDYIDSQQTISFPCPIHGGDNPTGSSILKRDIGNWKCYTAQCHEQYGTSNGASVIQFVQALLTITYNKPYTFPQAIEWCANFVGINLQDTQTNDHDRIDFIKLCKYINKKKQEPPTFVPRENVRKFLSIPSVYYIKRGYSRKILEKFDIGYCHNEKKPFFDRIVTPFYDDCGKYMVGCSGRSRYERCTQCRLFHSLEVRCPITKDEKLKCVKWKNSTLFNSSGYLYNYWNAKGHIIKTGTVILVEGPGDVWRLEEAGIYNSVALLKASLSNDQRLGLEMSGAINIIIATDMDEAGSSGARSIIEQCKHLFNVIRVDYETHDPGSLTIEQVRKTFMPILEKL